MNIRRHINRLNALILLLIFFSAYAGRSLHTHSAEYYASTRDLSANAGQGTISDNCPICHFHFFSFVKAEQQTLTIFFVLLGTGLAVASTRISEAFRPRTSLRGPPATL